MKLKAPIEVSSIEKIVIDREFLWELDPATYPNRMWNLWGRPKDEEHEIIRHMKNREQMSKYVNALIGNPKRRAWIHGDTLNIIQKEHRIS
jgi:hypothetical protein